METLRHKIREWLGIERQETKIKNLDALYSDLVHIGIDVHFKEPHMVLIVSKLGGGQIRHIPIKLETLKELNDLVNELKERYKTSSTTWDMPPTMRSFFKEAL